MISTWTVAAHEGDGYREFMVSAITRSSIPFLMMQLLSAFGFIEVMLQALNRTDTV